MSLRLCERSPSDPHERYAAGNVDNHRNRRDSAFFASVLSLLFRDDLRAPEIDRDDVGNFFLETFFYFSELNSIFSKCVWLKGYRKFAELDSLLGDPVALPSNRPHVTRYFSRY
jgi:hypothetical protein